jgi:hypothetical protein
MKNGEQTREAVGSSHSYPRGRQRRKAFSASHPQHPNERSQLSPYGTESEEIRARIYLRSEQPQLSPYGTESEEIRARIYLESEQPQALTRRMSELSTNQQGQIEHSQEDSFTSAQQLKKKASTISDEWDMLERDDIDVLPPSARPSTIHNTDRPNSHPQPSQVCPPPMTSQELGLQLCKTPPPHSRLSLPQPHPTPKPSRAQVSAKQAGPSVLRWLPQQISVPCTL